MWVRISALGYGLVVGWLVWWVGLDVLGLVGLGYIVDVFCLGGCVGGWLCWFGFGFGVCFWCVLFIIMYYVMLLGVCLVCLAVYVGLIVFVTIWFGFVFCLVVFNMLLVWIGGFVCFRIVGFVCLCFCVGFVVVGYGFV